MRERGRVAGSVVFATFVLVVLLGTGPISTGKILAGYLLVLAAAMLPAGLLGDRYGRKKVMLIALSLFGIGSAACAYAPSAGAFIAARVLLGLAGSGVIVNSSDLKFKSSASGSTL